MLLEFLLSLGLELLLLLVSCLVQALPNLLRGFDLTRIADFSTRTHTGPRSDDTAGIRSPGSRVDALVPAFQRNYRRGRYGTGSPHTVAGAAGAQAISPFPVPGVSAIAR